MTVPERMLGHDQGSEIGPRQATPFTRVWYWAFLVMGIVLIIGGLTTWAPAGSIADLPDGTTVDVYGLGINWRPIIHLLIGVPISVGAIISLIGAKYRETIDESWRLEQAGAIFGIVGWIGFALAAGYQHPSSIVDMLFPLTCAISLVIRWFTLHHREKIIRPQYEAKVKNNAIEIQNAASDIQVKAKEIQETQQ